MFLLDSPSSKVFTEPNDKHEVFKNLCVGEPIVVRLHWRDAELSFNLNLVLYNQEFTLKYGESVHAPYFINVDLVEIIGRASDVKKGNRKIN